MAHKPIPELRQRVELMAAVGIREDDISKILKIDPKTLRKHYRSELDLGHVKANGRVAAALFQAAARCESSADVRCAIFWMKTRAGWSELMPEVPREAPVEKLGKREQIHRDALTAGEGSDWGEDLAPLSNARLN